jgi:very-short-patch-repair endonuclease
MKGCDWRSEAAVAVIGAETDGIVVTAAALAAGVSLPALGRMRARGVLVSLGQGVDRLRDHPFGFRSRCRAALALAGPNAVLARRTAARFHGCYAYRSSDAIEVLVPRGRDHRTSIGSVIETRWLPPDHVTEVDGMPVTTLGRTFFDLCGDPDGRLSLRHPVHVRKMKAVYNDCLARRGMTFTMAVMVLSVLARRGRRGTRLVRQLLDHFGADHTPTWSDVETILDELIRSRGLPAPERQAAIAGPHGWIATVDFCWRHARHIVEIDSSWHDGPLEAATDEERDADLLAAGYTVARYRFGDLVLQPDRVASELAAVICG